MRTTAIAIARKLALAAAVAALVPATAHAREPKGPAARAVLTPAPTLVQVDARWGDRDRDQGDDDHGRRWRDGDGDREWRDGDRDAWRRPAPGWFAWRARERAELRASYQRLDGARARFYAVPEPPWRTHRFEAWYAHEHAELDARWARVS
jgi:hypothetical protein